MSWNLALLWMAQFVSNLGDWCLWVAIPITVYNRTGSKVDLAFTMFTEGLPYFIFSPIAGVLVDRMDRRRVMIASDIGRAALVALLALPLFKVIPLAEYYAVLFCASALSAFFMPARVAVMTQVVPRRQLMRVNAILSTSLQISEAIGPAVAGVILAVLLARGAFLADSVSFLISALCATGLSIVASPSIRNERMTLQATIADLRAGIAVIVETRILRGMLVAWNVGYFAAAIFTSLMYAFAKDNLHLGPQRYGFMMSCMGVGFLSAGMALAAWLHKKTPTSLIIAGLILSAIAAVGVSISRNTLENSAALFLFGFGGLLVNVPAQTLVQTLVHRQMLGRFSAAFSMVARLAQIAGAACAGFLASSIGLSKTYLFVALSYAASSVLASVLLRDRAASGAPSVQPLHE